MSSEDFAFPSTLLISALKDRVVQAAREMYNHPGSNAHTFIIIFFLLFDYV